MAVSVDIEFYKWNQTFMFDVLSVNIATSEKNITATNEVPFHTHFCAKMLKA